MRMPGDSRPIIYIFFGLIASGKSTLAGRFAAERNLPSYNTDRVRKELAGLAGPERCAAGYNQGIYTREFTEKTYQELCARAERDLLAGRSVVLDGSYHRRGERDRVRRLAAAVGATTVFILCRCDDETVRQRLEVRARDPEAVSDGRWEIYLVQKETFEEPDPRQENDIIILETARPLTELLGELTRI